MAPSISKAAAAPSPGVAPRSALVGHRGRRTASRVQPVGQIPMDHPTRHPRGVTRVEGTVSREHRELPFDDRPLPGSAAPGTGLRRAVGDHSSAGSGAGHVVGYGSGGGSCVHIAFRCHAPPPDVRPDRRSRSAWRRRNLDERVRHDTTSRSRGCGPRRTHRSENHREDQHRISSAIWSEASGF